MSAIAGIFSRTAGSTADPHALQRLSRALAQVGPDGETYSLASGVGMVHRPFHVRAGDRLGRQLIHDASGFMLAWDGDLDNARELRGALADGVSKEALEAELVLAAYQRWDTEAFARLYGAFAFALWDPRRQRLCLACDALGLRALYVHITPERVAWASRARALLEGLGLPEEFDEEYLADFLTNNASVHSPFRSIRPLPGGHVLLVERERESWKRYWTFDTRKELRYADDREYEEHFRQLFDQAIASSLQAEGPVFAELSGGVDSSSIACVADRLLKQGGVEASALHTLSYVFDKATSADERPFIHDVEAQLGRAGIHLREEDFPILGKRPPDSFRPDLPGNQLSFLARYDAVVERMQEAGSRVLLSGLGGDQAFWAQASDVPVALTDLVVERRGLELLRTCYQWSRKLQVPYLPLLFRGAVQPFLPRRWQPRLRELPVGEWFDEGFVRRTSLRQRALEPVDDLNFRLPSRSLQYGWLRRTMRHFALQTLSSAGHVEVRYPYLDRRLLEFALAIPLEQKLRPGESRSIVRRALVGAMPERVRVRRGKAGPTEAFQRALIRERSWLSEMFSRSRLARLGVIDAQRFQESFRRAQHGLVSHPLHLQFTVTLELWLQTFPERAASAAPPLSAVHS